MATPPVIRSASSNLIPVYSHDEDKPTNIKRSSSSGAVAKRIISSPSFQFDSLVTQYQKLALSKSEEALSKKKEISKKIQDVYATKIN